MDRSTHNDIQSLIEHALYPSNHSFQTTKLSELNRFRDRQSDLRGFLKYLHMIGSFAIQLSYYQQSITSTSQQLR